MLLPLILKKQKDLFKTGQNFLGIFLIISVVVFLSIEATTLFKQWYSGVEHSSYSSIEPIGIAIPTWLITILFCLLLIIPINSTKNLRQKKWVIILTILLINSPFLYYKFGILITNMHRDFLPSSNTLFYLPGFIDQTLIPSIICLALSLGVSGIKKRFLTHR
tara:strand:- start:33 stop:521 length:489 start_codon:yes stop_codon:yes gene_type:complete